MEIEEVLKAYLLTKTGLTALISTRILSDDMSGTMPCVVYHKVSDVKETTHDGKAPVEWPVFQYSSYASTKAAARAISNQLKSALCDYKGTLSGIVVQDITLLNEMSSSESAEGGGKYFIDDLEFRVVYNKE